jgi:hypothetical protein
MVAKTDGGGPVVGWTLNWKETFNSGVFGGRHGVMMAVPQPCGAQFRHDEPANSLFAVQTGQTHSAARLRDNFFNQLFQINARRLARVLLVLAHRGRGFPDNRALASLLDGAAHEESSDRDEPTPAAVYSIHGKSLRMSRLLTSGARN